MAKYLLLFALFFGSCKAIYPTKSLRYGLTKKEVDKLLGKPTFCIDQSSPNEVIFSCEYIARKRLFSKDTFSVQFYYDRLVTYGFNFKSGPPHL